MARKRVSRTRARINASKPKAKPLQVNLGIPKPAEDIESLLKEVESHMNAFNYDSAKDCCQKIIEMDSGNVKAMETLAGIFMDEGNLDHAETLYKRCIEVAPEDGHEKYFSLAQINDGKDSVDFYMKGISVIRKVLQNAENISPGKNSIPILKRALSDAFCSIAEVYMSDLCDEQGAEEACKEAIENALSADSENPEAYQSLASLLLVTQDGDPVAQMQRSLSLWLPQHESIRDKAELDHNCEVIIPEYASRLKTGKLLIELSMFEEASKVLDGLIDENDEDAFVWFLLGWSNYLHGPTYRKNAHFFLKKAKEVAMKLGNPDEDLIGQVDSLLAELADITSDDDCNEGEEGEDKDEDISSGDEEPQAEMEC